MVPPSKHNAYPSVVVEFRCSTQGCNWKIYFQQTYSRPQRLFLYCVETDDHSHPLVVNYDQDFMRQCLDQIMSIKIAKLETKSAQISLQSVRDICGEHKSDLKSLEGVFGDLNTAQIEN